jgi:GNAT superfamily N-acetyltransferase
VRHDLIRQVIGWKGKRERHVRVVPAEGQILEQILDESFPIWGEGLTRSAYGTWNRAQMETPWGRAHLGRVALVDETGLLASAKRYDLTVRLHGEARPVLGIGAVFTPPARRGRGHARELIERLIADTTAPGAVAMLFSEIDAAYYERLGFRVVPQRVATIEVHRGKGAPAVLVRSGEAADLPLVAQIAGRFHSTGTLIVDRTAPSMAFFLARRRLLAGLGPLGKRSVEFFVTEEGMRPVAFVVIGHGPAGAVLEDWGDNDPTGARVGAMLQVLSARTPANPPMRLLARLGHGPVPPQVRVLEETAATDVMMMRAIGPLELKLPAAGETKYPHLYLF